jgi:glutamate/tyrosine decarboxylase-like PLP-dependent enzyme
MNQMFGKTQPIAFLADILISVLNTSMYTYEVAPVLTLIEKETIAHLTSKIWGAGNGDGVLLQVVACPI